MFIGVWSLYIDLLSYAIDYASSCGASYAEARYHLRNITGIVIRGSKVIGVSFRKEEGIGIRVLYKGVLTFTSTNELSRERVREAIDFSIASAKALENIARGRGLSTEVNLGKASYEALASKPFDSKPMDVKIAELKDLWTTANNAVKESKLSSFAIIYNESEEVKEILTSDGAWIRSKIPRISIAINFVLLHPQKGTIQRILDFGSSGGLELINEWKVGEELENEVRAIENVLLRGVPPPKEPIDIVVGSEVVGLLVHESAGHPMEADRIWGREAAQAGESYVKPEMVKRERIGNEHATVIDDPTIPRSNGFYLYDDEGVPARPRYIYLNGIINELLHNRWTAKIFGISSNGAARAMNYASEPIPRMSNTYLTPGDMSFEELIEDINYGIYIKSYMEWNIDDIRWGQRYVGLEAYTIRKGELAEPVRNPVLELTTRAFYSSIVAKSKNLKFYPGMCGKGEPHQGVPVWFGGPEVRLSKMRLGVIHA